MISLNTSGLFSGNGLDVQSLVTQILSAKAGQLQLWQQQQSDLQTQAKLLSSISSDLSDLSSAVNSLSDILGSLTAQTAKSTQPSIVTGSADASATQGDHTIVVSALATQGTLYTDAVTDGDTSVLPVNTSSADLQIQIGGTGGATHDVAISAGTNDTPNKIAAYVNSQNWGVTATVLTDASGAQLAIYSQTTGTIGALAVTNNTTSLNFNPPLGGANASLTVDGIPFSSTTNTVTGAIPGVTLNLLGAFPSIQAQLSVAPDSSQAAESITTFVSAYNKVIGEINEQFKVDPSTNSQGPLAADGSLRALQSSLLSGVTRTVGNGAFASLASLGISMNDDGTLSVNATKLSDVLTKNPSAVQNFFQNTSLTGFANLLAQDLRNLSDPTQGLVTVDLAQNQQQQNTLNSSILDFQDRLAAEQQHLLTQFGQVNAMLQSFPFLLRSIDAQLGISSNGSSGSKG
jgi:flagellar hook-associated protein 2